MKILGKRIPIWVVVLAVVAVVALFFVNGGTPMMGQCPGSQVYCPGVGCLSGLDKCVPGNAGGPSTVFSREAFTTMKSCPGGTRTDGPCLLEFA
jgi:hypothetical protein